MIYFLTACPYYLWGHFQPLHGEIYCQTSLRPTDDLCYNSTSVDHMASLKRPEADCNGWGSGQSSHLPFPPSHLGAVIPFIMVLSLILILLCFLKCFLCFFFCTIQTESSTSTINLREQRSSSTLWSSKVWSFSFSHKHTSPISTKSLWKQCITGQVAKALLCSSTLCLGLASQVKLPSSIALIDTTLG